MFGRLDARLCTCRLRRCALASASGTELCAPARSNGVPSAGAGHAEPIADLSAGAGHAEPIADPSAGAGHTEPIASPTVRLDFGAPAQRAEYAMSVLRSAFCGTAQGVQMLKDGACDALSTDKSAVMEFAAPGTGLVLLPFTISREPLALATRDEDPAWSAAVSWVLNGLVLADRDGIEVTSRGRLLIRNICMAFDQYLPHAAETKFSRVL